MGVLREALAMERAEGCAGSWSSRAPRVPLCSQDLVCVVWQWPCARAAVRVRAPCAARALCSHGLCVCVCVCVRAAVLTRALCVWCVCAAPCSPGPCSPPAAPLARRKSPSAPRLSDGSPKSRLRAHSTDRGRQQPSARSVSQRAASVSPQCQSASSQRTASAATACTRCVSARPGKNRRS